MEYERRRGRERKGAGVVKGAWEGKGHTATSFSPLRALNVVKVN